MLWPEKLAGRKVIASVSGGKDSAALSLWLTEQGIEHDYVKAGATILTERTKTEKLLVAQFLPEAIPAAAAPHAMPQEEW